MRVLELSIGNVVIRAELLDTPTTDALYAAAPFKARAATWGEEVWFTTPVSLARTRRQGRGRAARARLLIAMATRSLSASAAGRSRSATTAASPAHATSGVRRKATSKR
jgi:hypothetical protein